MKERSEIVVIFNKYRDTLNNLIDNSDIEFPNWPDFPNWPGLIDKRSRNALRSRGGLSILSKEDCLDEDILVTSLEPVPKIQAFQVHQCYDIAYFSLKSKRTQYGNNQRGGEDRKSKQSGENGKGKRGKRGY